MDISFEGVAEILPVACFIVRTLHRTELDSGILVVGDDLRSLDEVDHFLTERNRIEELHVGGLDLDDRNDDLRLGRNHAGCDREFGLLVRSRYVAEILHLIGRKLLRCEDRVDNGYREGFDIFLAGFFQLCHGHRVVLVDDTALTLDRIVENEIDQRIEIARKMLVFGLERTFGGTNVLDALDNGLFLRFFHVFKTDGCRNLIVDDIYQTYDHQGKNQLNDFFHFNYLFKFVSRLKR